MSRWLSRLSLPLTLLLGTLATVEMLPAAGGVMQVDRWTFVGTGADPGNSSRTRTQFRRETFELRPDGSSVRVTNHGIHDYFRNNNGSGEDDAYAIAARQAVAGKFVAVEYAVDTDSDKASFSKVGARFRLDSATDPYVWTEVAASPSSPDRTLGGVWNSLRSIYDQNSGSPSAFLTALREWLFNEFAGLSFLDQLNFASGAEAAGFNGAMLRHVEAILRSGGFPIRLERLLPANGIDISLRGTPNIAVLGSVISLGGINIVNNRSNESGPLKLSVYALRDPYLGGAVPAGATLLATVQLSDSIASGGRVTDASFDRAALTSLPEGLYYLALVLTDAAGAAKDYVALPTSFAVGTITGVNPAEADMPTQLINLSTRLRVDVNENVGIGGFVVSGSGSKRVILRAIGPSLANYGVSGALTNVSMELRNAAGNLIGQNTGWQSGQRTEIEASGFAPADTRESAIVATLAPGSYTVIVRGVGGTSGVALIEMYDLERSRSDLRPINVSTRGRVLSADNVMIGGFVISGTRTRRVLVRAVGPSLAAVPGIGSAALSNPSLELRDRSGLLASNDDWVNSERKAQIEATAHKPTDSREAAIIVTLAPGAYTAIVRGEGGATGLALVEVYDLE
ncbi:MAG: hypothetical protein JSR82_02520 [Verrucomicrobia bacterium]|nr:hypothetical protein [Verrucomicrobiota bacterium]